MRRHFFGILLSCCLALPTPLFAWWETGHQTVARIAAAHLTPAARTRVARILEVPDDAKTLADALAKVSTWADDTKNETKTAEWHYIDLALQDEKSSIPARCKDDNCAPARIRLFAAQLSSQPADARWSQLDALRFLVHFVGDIHQPLHAISDADLGGNCERLDPPVNRAKNLHSLWDGGIVNAMDADDRELAADLEKEVEALGSGRAHELAQGSPNDWAWESHQLAIKNVYGRLHIPLEPVEFPANCSEAPLAITEFKPPIDGLYIDDMKPVVRSQIEKAGLRLARLLNESL
jgi:S1/P1 Nuclease